MMNKTIAEAQEAIVEGRQILDAILTANKAVEEYRSECKKGALLKIDFEKAYDRMEWPF